MRTKTPRIYSHAVIDAVNAAIPASIREAMSQVGWNALGIYEVVDETLKQERRNRRRDTPKEPTHDE